MVAAESLGKNRIGRIRLEPTPEGRLTLVNFTQRVVTPAAMIKTDGARELRRTSKSRGLLFYRLIQQAAITGPHPIKSLVIPRDDSAAYDVTPTPGPAPLTT